MFDPYVATIIVVFILIMIVAVLVYRMRRSFYDRGGSVDNLKSFLPEWLR